MRLLSVLVLTVALLVSGCTGGGASTASGTPTPTKAAPATVTDETGGIEGVVLSEEALPLPNVNVGLVKTGALVRTDNEGRFSFSNLTPEKYQLVFSRVGYADAGRSVEVQAGEVTKLNLTMEPMAIVEAYVEGPFVFNGYNQIGSSLLDIFTNGMAVGCQKCQLQFNVSETVVQVILELSIKPTIQNPQGDDMYFQLYDTDDGEDLGTVHGNTDWKHGQKFVWDATSPLPLGQPLPVGKKTWFIMNNYCPTTWVCFDQKFDVYYTFFHGESAPEDFTALPKP